MNGQDKKQEPADHQNYMMILYHREFVIFLIKTLKFYKRLLENDIKAIDADPDLKEVLDEKQRQNFSVHQESQKVEHYIQWFQEAIEKDGGSSYHVHLSMSHGTIRYLKSVAALYIKHLRQRRDTLASRPNISKYALEAVDQRISGLEEEIQRGVYKDASPVPLLAGELLPAQAAQGLVDPAPSLATQTTPRPVVIESIEILDAELRKRCLDLFSAFQKDGQQERLDTVLNEATRILEDRLRKLSGAPATCIGPELAAYCFGSQNPRLNVSDVVAEQEAAHLLFRGVFGFIRNRVHHSLVANLQPERVLQVVGTIDYLLSVAQAATMRQEQ